MIDSDRIEEEARNRTFHLLDDNLRDDPERVLMNAFEYGVEWYKEDLWHSFFEKPEEDGKVLCQDINNEFILVEADCDWKQKVGIYDIQKWCYLNDLL